MSQELMTVPQAARAMPPRGVSLPTMWRWILRGLNGRKLRSVLVGGRRYVPTEAIAEWLQPVDSAGVTADRTKQIEAAERELQEHGI